jgi:gag-pre-integrase-like protein
LNTNKIVAQNFKCLKAITDDPKLWHRRLGHINTHTMHELISKYLVKGLPDLDCKHSPSCDACIRGKQVRSSFKPKKMVSTSRPCEFLHIDLCDPMHVRSTRGKSYILVIVDDYSRFTRDNP